MDAKPKPKPKPNRSTLAITSLVVPSVGVLIAYLIPSFGIIPYGCLPSLFNRRSFPNGFLFGAASAAYQFEGAHNIDGRGASIWDTFTHEHPEKIADRSTGDVAVDQYHLFKSDMQLLKDSGMDSYRFSISWSRVLPQGKLYGGNGVNPDGIRYYNELIDEIVKHGMTPFVTLFHWDLPQHLEFEYGGFLSSRIVPDFRDFAGLCFEKFGDRVKHWITLNEPWTFSNRGYNLGDFAPGRCSDFIGDCNYGNSGTEPYNVTHNLLLAHAAAVKVYKDKYQAKQNGVIGITLVSWWFVPFKPDNKEDKDAKYRALDFMLGWYMDPLTNGDYPTIMKSIVGNRLPTFYPNESDIVRGSYDFIGVNYYTAYYASNNSTSSGSQPSYLRDYHVDMSSHRNDEPIGAPTPGSWLYIYPQGLRDLLVYIKESYNDPVIYITESGIGNHNNDTMSLEQALFDKQRTVSYCDHLKYLLLAIKEGVKVRGLFAWGFLDNFEWTDGYTIGFGVNYVNLTSFTRHTKMSSIWFERFLSSNWAKKLPLPW